MVPVESFEDELAATLNIIDGDLESDGRDRRIAGHTLATLAISEG